MQELKAGQIYILNRTKRVYAILYNENYDAWDFVKLTSSDSEKQFIVGGRWNLERLRKELAQHYTLIGHLEELDIESYLEEKKVKC